MPNAGRGPPPKTLLGKFPDDMTRELARNKPPITNAIDEFESWLRFRRRFRKNESPVLLDSPPKLFFDPGQNPRNN